MNIICLRIPTTNSLGLKYVHPSEIVTSPSMAQRQFQFAVNLCLQKTKYHILSGFFAIIISISLVVLINLFILVL